MLLGFCSLENQGVVAVTDKWTLPDRHMDDGAIPFPRALASALEEAMLDTPVVCLLGPRQCGKTTLAMSLEKGRGYFSLDEDG